MPLFPCIHRTESLNPSVVTTFIRPRQGFPGWPLLLECWDYSCATPLPSLGHTFLTLVGRPLSVAKVLVPPTEGRKGDTPEVSLRHISHRNGWAGLPPCWCQGKRRCRRTPTSTSQHPGRSQWLQGSGAGRWWLGKHKVAGFGNGGQGQLPSWI